MNARKAIAFIPKWLIYFTGKVGYSMNQVLIPLYCRIAKWEAYQPIPESWKYKVRICPFHRFSKTLKRSKERSVGN